MPKATKRPVQQPWTDEDVQVLRESVAGAETLAEGLRMASQRLGRTVGTVQQKWYKMKAPTNGGAAKPEALLTFVDRDGKQQEYVTKKDIPIELLFGASEISLRPVNRA